MIYQKDFAEKYIDRRTHRPFHPRTGMRIGPAVIALILSACGSPIANAVTMIAPGGTGAAIQNSTVTHTLPPTTPTPGATSTPTATSTPQVINPLTGLSVADKSLIERRPLAVKVSNYPRTARPQAGLSYADLLFEFYQEAGLTRWQALYLSRDVEKVGPIRSGRKIDVPLMRAYQSFLVFNAEYDATWDYMDFEGVRNLLLYLGPVNPSALWEDPNQLFINRVYGNTAELRKEAKRLKLPDIVPDLNGMVFQDEPPAMSGKASTVRVRFLTDTAIVEWRYNPEDHKYYRWSETGKPNADMTELTDRLTGEQLSVDNVIVIYVNYIARQHREIYELELFGGGKALFFRDGMVEDDAIWRLPKIDRPLQFFGPDGPFYLRPGVTWIGIVEDSSTDYQEGDTRRIEFGQPGRGE
jgi:hypothetical protein